MSEFSTCLKGSTRTEEKSPKPNPKGLRTHLPFPHSKHTCSNSLAELKVVLVWWLVLQNIQYHFGNFTIHQISFSIPHLKGLFNNTNLLEAPAFVSSDLARLLCSRGFNEELRGSKDFSEVSNSSAMGRLKNGGTGRPRMMLGFHSGTFIIPK